MHARGIGHAAVVEVDLIIARPKSEVARPAMTLRWTRQKSLFPLTSSILQLIRRRTSTLRLPCSSSDCFPSVQTAKLYSLSLNWLHPHGSLSSSQSPEPAQRPLIAFALRPRHEQRRFASAHDARLRKVPEGHLPRRRRDGLAPRVQYRSGPRRGESRASIFERLMTEPFTDCVRALRQCGCGRAGEGQGDVEQRRVALR